MIRSTHSVKLREALEEVRPAFKALSRDLALVRTTRAELAPTFHRTWLLWKRETHRPFVAFVQALDSSVPADRAGYRKHASYHAAVDLLDLVRKPNETKRRGLTPLSLAAVVLKSVLPLFNAQEKEVVLEAIAAASKWRDRDVSRLLASVRKAKPVALPKVPRLVEGAKASKAAVLAFERKREHAAAVA